MMEPSKRKYKLIANKKMSALETVNLLYGNSGLLLLSIKFNTYCPFQKIMFAEEVKQNIMEFSGSYRCLKKIFFCNCFSLSGTSFQ